MVPLFRAVLSSAFGNVVPLYFWSSREGSSTAPSHPLRAVAVYPRRPKFSRDGVGPIMKINKEVASAAAEFRSRGIPTFAAFPRARSAFDLAQGAPFLWFAFSGCGEEEDVEIPMDSALPTWLEGPLTEEAVRRIATQESVPRSWEDVLKAIRDVSHAVTQGSHWRFGVTYKPVYFLNW